GWGCSWNQHRAHGYWTPFEAKKSINWRELKAAFLALQTFSLQEHSTVLIQTDNTTSLSYINKQGGTRSLALLDLATERSEQQDGRHGISQDLLQESVEDQSLRLPMHNQPMGTLLSRPIRRKDDQTATGSGRYLYGCVYHPMDDVSSSLPLPSMESHYESAPCCIHICELQVQV
ncbi:hypothetical protein, partial, partial [Parasitella parasitica]